MLSRNELKIERFGFFSEPFDIVLASLIVGKGNRVKPLNTKEIAEEYGSVDQQEQVPSDSV